MEANNVQIIPGGSFIPYMVLLATSLLFCGARPARATDTSEVVKTTVTELQTVLQSYQSETLRQQIEERIHEVDSSNPKIQRQAIEYLLDLRNEALSVWLLVHGKDVAVDVLGQRKLKPDDARFVAQAMFRMAMPQEKRPNSEVQECQMGLLTRMAKHFCECIRQPFADLPGYSADSIAQWMGDRVAQASKGTDKTVDADTKLLIERLAVIAREKK